MTRGQVFRNDPAGGIAVLLFMLVLGACSGGGSGSSPTGSTSGPSTQQSSPVAVNVSPANTSISTIQAQQFTAVVSNSATSAVTWQVDGVGGGSPGSGLISTDGLYTPPPAEGQHTISAASVDAPSRSGSVSVTVKFLQGVLTYHNDNARTGQNQQEVLLTPSNVTSASFGKVATWPVDGYVFAQPLYVANVPIGGQLRNVVYVATEHNSVYAFDADQLTGAPIWRVSFINPAAGITTVPFADTATPPGFTGPGPVLPAGCADVVPEIGITGTPVIDPGTGTLYVVAQTREQTGAVVAYRHRLYALDITNGAARTGSGQIVQGSVTGTSLPQDGRGHVVFQSLRQNQRAALLLNNHAVSVAFGSFCDILPFQGWMMTYDAKTLQLLATFNAAPNDPVGKGGIWHSSGGPAADANGNVFVITGDGPFDPTAGRSSYGDSVLRMTGGLSAVADYFTPYNQLSLSTTDTDLGSGGPMLIPDQSSGAAHLMVVVGKQGVVYLLNRDNMGKFQSGSDSQILQSFFGGLCGVGACALRGTAAYFNNNVYMVAVSDGLKSYSLLNGQLARSGQSTNNFRWPGATPVVSANGVTNGIVWALETSGSGATAVLHAYPATNVSMELYNSNQVLARDNPGPSIKYAIPTVANGKVYIGSASQVLVFGLLP
jgi:hypothetical protein